MSTAYGDPNSDVAYTWSDDAANDYQRIDDGVRDPTLADTGGDGQLCHAGPNDDSETASFGCAEPSISGTVTAVRVKAFMGADTDTLSMALGAYFNSSSQTPSNKNVTTSPGWHTTTYSSLSIPAASFFPWRVDITTPTLGKSDGLNLYAAYLEVDYTTGGGGETTHSRTLTNTLGSADSEGGAGVGQTILLAILFRRAISHALELSEFISPAAQLVRSCLVADILSSAEVPRRTAECQRDIQEALHLGEQQRLLTAAFRAVGDPLAILDIPSLQSLIARLVIDLAAAGDNVALSVLRRVMIADATGLEDLQRHASEILRALADVVGLTDGIAREADVRRILLDLVEFPDDVIRRRIIGNVLPGDTDFVSIGPSEATFDSTGPGSAGPASLGPGNATVIPKGSGD